MFFNYLPDLRMGVVIFSVGFVFFVHVSNAQIPASGDSCLRNYNFSNVINKYFSGWISNEEMNQFFYCVDNAIDSFLTYAKSGHSQYYTISEIANLLVYIMKVPPYKANQMSRALFQIKVSFVGGRPDRLSRTEVDNLRRMLRRLNMRMKEMHSSVSVLLRVLQQQPIRRDTLMNATQTIKDKLVHLGKSMSGYGFRANLNLLENVPDHLDSMGFSVNLEYWKPLILLIKYWNKMFYGSSGHIISSSEWPVFMNAVGEFIGFWFYYERFIRGKRWSETYVIQHVQDLTSRFLQLVEQTWTSSSTNTVALTDMDQLIQHPWISRSDLHPVLALGTRSVFCFLLSRHADDETCSHHITLQRQGMNIRF